MIPYRGAALPIVRLSRLFGLARYDARPAAPVRRRQRRRRRSGIAVDRIVGQREIVVRAIADPLVRVDGISGATDLGDGRVVLILDPAALARQMRERPDRSIAARRGSDRRDTGEPRRRGIGSYILFTVAGTTYALPSGEVRHMEMVEEITRVPNAPAFIDGVVFSRGQVVPVVNLRARFGFERAPYDLRQPADRRPAGRPAVGLVADARARVRHDSAGRRSSRRTRRWPA